MPTYRLDLEYDGTRYHGWQVQQNARSIAGELQRAIVEAGGAFVELGGSGRTDAGVHAQRQTAHLRLRQAVEAAAFRHEINARLPGDVHVLDLAPAAAAFHARHDAIGRSYLYQISRRRTGLAKRWVWWVRAELDARRLAAAAERLVGRHDFRQFCEQPAAQPSTLVVVERAEVAEAGDLVLVRLVASHFLWKMVRRVVGTLVQAGAGTLALEPLAELLRGQAAPAGQAGPAQWTAPASGLYLERVLYPGEAPLGPLVPAVPVLGERAPAGTVYCGPASGRRPRAGR